MATLLLRDAIRFEFAGYDNVVDPVGRTDRLCLDTGNALGPGAIDHHHLPAFSGSAAGLVLQHPELVVEAVRPDRSQGDPFTIVLHQQPDLDCVASAYLAICLLTTGTLPTAAEPLARYVDRVDAGHPGFSQQSPYSLYAAYLLLVHDRAGSGEPGWLECMIKGLEVVEFVVDRVESEGISILEVDAFACERVFRSRDRREIENDLSRYRGKLEDPACSCRRLKLRLPSQFGGTQEVDTLLARDVQNVKDPNRCIYFKDWARTDTVNSSGGGFAALSVFVSEDTHRETDPKSGQVRRCIISVAPGSGVTIKGLGEKLDEAEAACRIERYGVDDRVVDPATGVTRPIRPGYSNADPWYDGRGHQYTIVDSPRSGTLLSADRIEEIFVAFGRRSESDAAPFRLPALLREPEAGQPVDGPGQTETLGQLTSLVDEWRSHHGKSPLATAPPEIFISYSRKGLSWVESHVAAPLMTARGRDRVFFDKSVLEGGMSWLTELADGVMNCQLFLPVYSSPYFLSDFCQWELQLAVTRDPTGRKRIIVPIMLEEVELPPYCRLIQAQLAEGDSFSDRLVELVRGILG